MKKAEYDQNPRGMIEPVTQAIIDDADNIIGVLDGDPNDFVQMRSDLAHIASVRGMLGHPIAELSTKQEEADAAKTVKKHKLFLDYQRKILRGDLDGKANNDTIWAYVYQDDDYKVVKQAEIDARRLYYSFYNLREGLLGLENALKKILDFGKDQ